MRTESGDCGESLVAVVTTDLAAITRGRFVLSKALAEIGAAGVGWLQANLCLTAFNSIANPNPWGSRGDLRLLPDLDARFRSVHTGSHTPFDMVCGDLVELDGTPWSCCTRTLLRQALADFRSRTGLSLIASFEQEFQVFDADLPPGHSFSFAALRRADPFAPRIMAALIEADLEPDVIIAEYGQDQFEVTVKPADALVAADRCVAVREMVREIARNEGWHASFAPKTAPDGVGNGVHIHFSFRDKAGKPVMYEPGNPGGLSDLGGSFCAGILRHLPALTALTAPSVPSYYRLVPHTWSASYTSLAVQDREAALRIAPMVSFGGGDPAAQFNIEYRAADAVANPYLALTAIVRAGLEGLLADLSAPPLVTGDPTRMSEADRGRLGLIRLPETLDTALGALAGDDAVNSWFDPLFIESFIGVKRAEMAQLSSMEAASVCETYRKLY